MLLPYTQRIRDPKDFDYQLAQMIYEPHTDMKDDMDLHDQENRIAYDRDALRRAKFVSGPHFWNDKDGAAYVTIIFDVRTRYTERERKGSRVTVLE